MLPRDEYFAELRKFPTSFRAGVELYYSPDRGMEILLEERGKDDIFFGGRWALFASTILMEETIEAFWDRHAKNETGLETKHDAPPWTFCGIVETPHTERHHGIVQVFGRVWHERPKTRNGVWFPLNNLNTIEIVPSEVVVFTCAKDVLIEKKQPYHVQYLGTDKREE
jgi:ADP-ribose pyrophosphatase YjhB (NUDIX family)